MRRQMFRWLLPVLLLCGGVSGAPLSPEEGGPSPDAVWRNDFSDPENLGKEWKFDGSRFMEQVNRYITDNISNAGMTVEDIADAVQFLRKTMASL